MIKYLALPCSLFVFYYVMFRCKPSRIPTQVPLFSFPRPHPLPLPSPLPFHIFSFPFSSSCPLPLTLPLRLSSSPSLPLSPPLFFPYLNFLLSFLYSPPSFAPYLLLFSLPRPGLFHPHPNLQFFFSCFLSQNKQRSHVSVLFGSSFLSLPTSFHSSSGITQTFMWFLKQLCFYSTHYPFFWIGLRVKKTYPLNLVDTWISLEDLATSQLTCNIKKQSQQNRTAPFIQVIDSSARNCYHIKIFMEEMVVLNLISPPHFSSTGRYSEQ